MSGLCNSIASALSESYVWLTLAELATAVLLERIHFRWTNSIVGRTSHAAHTYHWRKLGLPTIIYALARKVVAELPATIGSRFIAEGEVSTDAVAARDIVVLASAFALRFFLLYPAWASLTAFEIRCTSRSTDSLRDQSSSYVHVVWLCYQRALVRISWLHIQAAGIMISIETVTYTVTLFLLHVNSSSIVPDMLTSN